MKKEKHFFLAGEKYLYTSKLLLDKMSETNNKWIIISDKEIQENELEKLTEYSDFNIMIPTLFNFYHGLELLIKGMIELHNENNESFDTIHQLDKLFNKLKDTDHSGNEYIDIISKYIEKPLKIDFLNDFMQTENINKIHDLYMSFRYPADVKFLKFNNYIDLQYRGDEIINDINEMSIDIKRILIGAIKVCRDKESRQG